MCLQPWSLASAVTLLESCPDTASLETRARLPPPEGSPCPALLQCTPPSPQSIKCFFLPPCFPWPLVLVGHVQAWASSWVPHSPPPRHWGQPSFLRSGDTWAWPQRSSAGGRSPPTWPVCPHTQAGDRVGGASGSRPRVPFPGPAAQGPGRGLGPTALRDGRSSPHVCTWEAAWVVAHCGPVAALNHFVSQKFRQASKHMPHGA